MNFIVSSAELFKGISATSRVIASKSPVPILNNCLLEVSKDCIKIVASDIETTIITEIKPDEVMSTGTIAVGYKLLGDILKEIPDQPIEIIKSDKTDENETNGTSHFIDIISTTGKYSTPVFDGDDFPAIPELDNESKITFKVNPEILLCGIATALPATANDELRPMLNGIFFELKEDEINFVATDSSSLVRYSNKNFNIDEEASFIMQKKGGAILKSLLSKQEDDVIIEFDKKFIKITLENTQIISLRVEGNYPNYRSVLPNTILNTIIIDRLEMVNALRRVSLFTDKGNGLVVLDITETEMVIMGQDIEFQTSGQETVSCEFSSTDGMTSLRLCFRADFLVELLSSLSGESVQIKNSSISAGSLIQPLEEEEGEETLMLLMPLKITV
ncbi:MAG: DNA polymerase III subunit beta [Bacteroidales bacterium]